MTENGQRITSLRLDSWLWAARFFKTRAIAAAAVDGGKVEVNGARAKRAKALKPGDRVRLRKGPFEYQLTVRGLAQRRGPPAAAAALYEEDPATRAARERLAEQLRIAPSVRFEGKGRPTKKDRRDLDRFSPG
jgi:ribosome-associated heat shock protein Hsp15